jgi:hypothetical protein
MDDGVWISNAMIDEERMLPLRSDISLHDRNQAIEAQRRNNRGEVLAAQDMPKEVYGTDNATWIDSLPDFFSCGGYWAVSGACADILRGFHLGAGGLYPVEIFQRDRTTPVPGSYYSLNFGTVKEAFQPDGSPRARKIRYREGFWSPPILMKDGDIAVSTAALAGSDLWVDPKMERAFFVSGGLARALTVAELNLGLRRCRIA